MRVRYIQINQELTVPDDADLGQLLTGSFTGRVCEIAHSLSEDNEPEVTADIQLEILELLEDDADHPLLDWSRPS